MNWRVNISSLPKYPTKKIAIIRDEGSNSHREMAYVFSLFQCIIYDFTINELILNNKNICDKFLDCDGYIFVGGFAYGDVLGSGRATALIMKLKLQNLFDKIFTDKNKFVLGICNGCQILVEYGLFGNYVKMEHNDSKKFECRWLGVYSRLPNTNKYDNKRGIWIAHGEGKFKFNNLHKILGDILIDTKTNKHIIKIIMKYESKYTGDITYPLNPN